MEEIRIEIDAYKAFDGKVFHDKSSCEYHESRLIENKEFNDVSDILRDVDLDNIKVYDYDKDDCRLVYNLFTHIVNKVAYNIYSRTKKQANRIISSENLKDIAYVGGHYECFYVKDFPDNLIFIYNDKFLETKDFSMVSVVRIT